MLVSEIVTALFLTAGFIYQMIVNSGYTISWLIWSVLSMSLAFVLGITFLNLKALQEKIDGIFCDDKLMRTHWIFFALAASCDAILLYLTIEEHIEHQEVYDECENIDKDSCVRSK